MDCPFPLYMPDNEDEEDPEIDKDEEQMSERKPSQITPIEEFQVTKKPPHHSEFDDEMRKKREEEEEEARIRDATIDDDQPDYEKEDEYGQSRMHCWVLL